MNTTYWLCSWLQIVPDEYGKRERERRAVCEQKIQLGVRPATSDGAATTRALGRSAVTPSLCTRAWSVVRLIPSCAAAPRGPPITQLHDCSARKMASRWMSSSVGSEPGCATEFGSFASTARASTHARFRSSSAGPLVEQLRIHRNLF